MRFPRSLRRLEGVVQTADQVVDVAAGGVNQQDLAAAMLGLDAAPLLPLLCWTVEIGKGLGREACCGDFGSRQLQQRHAQGWRLLNLGSLTILASSDDSTPSGTDPVTGPQLLTQQQWQQPWQVTGVSRRCEDQGQVGFTSAAQLADDILDRFVEGRVR